MYVWIKWWFTEPSADTEAFDWVSKSNWFSIPTLHDWLRKLAISGGKHSIEKSITWLVVSTLNNTHEKITRFWLAESSAV